MNSLLTIFSTTAMSSFMYQVLFAQKLSLYALVAIVLLATLSMTAKRGISWLLYWAPLSNPSPRKFLGALTLLFFHHLLEYGAWVFLLWWVGGYLFGTWLPLMFVAGAVALIYVPGIFSFFGLVPFFGKFISWLVALSTAVVFVYTAQSVLGMTLVQAILVGILGTVVAKLQQWVLTMPLYSMQVGHVRSTEKRAAIAFFETPGKEDTVQPQDRGQGRIQERIQGHGKTQERMPLSPQIDIDAHAIPTVPPASLMQPKPQPRQREQQPHG